MVEKRSRKDRLEAKGRRLKAKVRQEILTPEKLVVLAIPVLMLVWLVGSISSLSRNWNLQQEINERKTELEYLKLQVDSIELENEYYASEEYQELTARRLQDKKLAGETMIFLPENSDEAKKKHLEATKEQKGILNEKSNVEQWVNFLFSV